MTIRFSKYYCSLNDKFLFPILLCRSTTLVLAYLMKYKNMSLKDAYNLVKSKRKIIKPNPGFWSQLVEFEKEVFGKSSVQMIEGPSGLFLLICDSYDICLSSRLKYQKYSNIFIIIHNE